ncbi:hypothetical protein [Actinomadura sp. 9N407]|uniref:hypothetical protein n=1 Tax=Actinomadura sp. 9N407 TaxID=3375154 RepID=UPI0037AF9E52
MTVGTGLAMIVRGMSATLGGTLLAALVVVAATVADPEMSRSPGFLRASGVAAVLLYGMLGFAGTRFGGRPLRDLDAPSEAAPLIACFGPLLVGLPIQVGVAASGQPLVSALSACSVLAGTALGAWRIRRQAGTGARRVRDA